MGNTPSWRRIVPRVDAARRGLLSIIDRIAQILGVGSGVDLHTIVTIRAVVDAVLPETPEVG